jgi:thymidylate synthase ThyX
MLKTKQQVRLLHISPLWLIANGIRYSHATWDKSDSVAVRVFDRFDSKLGKKDFELIKRVGFKLKHESVLEMSQIVFDVKMSQKALLEESRHRIGISKVATSSRLALKKIEIEMEPTGDEDIDEDLELIKQIIIKRLKQGKSLDKVSKLLPQAFIYTLQIQFNLRSLLHFLRLRLDKSAHRDIRIIAFKMVEALPGEWVELILEDKDVEKKLKETERWFYEG